MDIERRICNFTSRPINANDRASVQILLANLGEEGTMTGEITIVDISGDIRASGRSDSYMTEYSKDN